MEFDFGQRWAIALDDADFARMWTALGVAAASPFDVHDNWFEMAEKAATASQRDPGFDIARHALTDALSASRERGGVVHWRFPLRDSMLDVVGRHPLARISPASWAAAWAEVANA